MEGLTREKMRPLLDLQRTDSATDRLVARRANLPEQIELDELAARRGEIAGVHAERKKAFDEVALQQSRMEGEVSMLDEKISKESDRLYGGDITNPKELAGIQAEIDALRRRKNHVEDQLIDVMEQREALEGEVAGLQSQLEETDRQIADATQRRDTASVDIQHELEQLEAERARLRPQFPQEVLDLYEELRGRKDGVATAALVEKVCMGCHVELTPMAREEIRRSSDPIIRCENCRRLLVIAE